MAINPKSKIISVVLLIVAIIVVFQIVGNSSTDLSESGDAITQANGCNRFDDAAGTPSVYNVTDGLCHNSSGVADDRIGNQQTTMPLNNLFAANGIVFLIFMSGVLLMILIVSLKTIKDKKK